MLRLRYGNYIFRIGSPEISIDRQPIPNAMGVPMRYVESWSISGRIHNPGRSAVDIQPYLSAFESAFSIHAQDLVLEHDNGVTTSHGLYSNDCIGGTRVSLFPSFPTGRHGELVSFRTFRVSVQGEKFAPDVRSQILQWSEQISVSGGGWRRKVDEVNFGPGVQQRTRTHSKCVATQSGQAVGYLYIPEVPPAIWPNALTDQFPNLSLASPKTVGQGISARQVEKSITWSYSYESTQRLYGVPHFLLG